MKKLSELQISKKVNDRAHKEVPIGVAHLTAYVDVPDDLQHLYWMVVGWEADFTGYIIDYGLEPEPPGNPYSDPHFYLPKHRRRTLATETPEAGTDRYRGRHHVVAAIYAGLERLAERLLGADVALTPEASSRRIVDRVRHAVHKYLACTNRSGADDKARLRIDRCLVGANDCGGLTADAIYQFCRESKYAGVLLPSHGYYAGAGGGVCDYSSSKSFEEYLTKHGERGGSNCRIALVADRRAERRISYDANYWESFVQARLAVALGDPGCLSLFERSQPFWGYRHGIVARHRLLSEHLASEYRIPTEGRGRSVEEEIGNSWLKCLVGCAVAGAVCGATLPGLQQVAQWFVKPDQGQRKNVHTGGVEYDGYEDKGLLTADQIAAKVNGMVSKEVPNGVKHLTAYVDVQYELLHWMVVGWEADFTGYIIDYGTEPEQEGDYFSEDSPIALRDIRQTLLSEARNAGATVCGHRPTVTQALHFGLQRLAERLLGTKWLRDDGAKLRIERCLVGGDWGQTADAAGFFCMGLIEEVDFFCRKSKYAGALLPSHGLYGASRVIDRRAERRIIYDVHYWKSFVHARLAVALGDPGSLSLFERREHYVAEEPHRLLSEHLANYYRIRTGGRGGQWGNNWLNCLAGCAVAGAVCGATLPGLQQEAPWCIKPDQAQRGESEQEPL